MAMQARWVARSWVHHTSRKDMSTASAIPRLLSRSRGVRCARGSHASAAERSPPLYPPILTRKNHSLQDPTGLPPSCSRLVPSLPLERRRHMCTGQGRPPSDAASGKANGGSPGSSDTQPSNAQADSATTDGARSTARSSDGAAKGVSAANLPHQVSELYADMERTLMSKMHAQDKKQFRAIGLSSVLLLVWVLSMFGTEIRKYFASQTAQVARETLKVEALQVQTQELATALVQALLNDQEVVRAGALFLREASADPETRAALVSLALYVLQHPDTLAETLVLGKKLVRAILDDPETIQQVTELSLEVMKAPRFRQGSAELVVALGASEDVYLAVTDLTSRVMQDPEVQATLSAALSASSHEVLEDPEVLDHSKEFVAQVMGDDAVQRSGGDALWNTVQYALQTRAMKATGFLLLVASAAVLSGKGGRGLDWGRRGKD